MWVRTNCMNKIANKAAFTLAETLVAILIMLMVSGIMVAGIPAARDAYVGVTASSNAQILLSTAVSALRNELGTAGSVQSTDNGKSVTFYNSNTHTFSKISKRSSDGMIMYEEYAQKTLQLTDSKSIPLSQAAGEAVTLVPEKAIDEGQTVTYESISVDEAKGVVTFEGMAVKKGTAVLAPKAAQNISVRTVSGSAQ